MVHEPCHGMGVTMPKPTKDDAPPTRDLDDQHCADHSANRRRGRVAEVLIAEDDDDMRRLVVHALREEGFHVVSARDGWALLEHIGNRMLERGGHPLDL